MSSYACFLIFSVVQSFPPFLAAFDPAGFFPPLPMFRQNVPQECVTTHFCLYGSPPFWSLAPYFFALFFSYSEVFLRPPPSPPLSAVTLCLHVQNVTRSIFKAVTAVLMIRVSWNITPFRLQYGKGIVKTTKFNLLAMWWWNTFRLTTTCFGLQVGHHQVVLLLEIKWDHTEYKYKRSAIGDEISFTGITCILYRYSK